MKTTYVVIVLVVLVLAAGIVYALMKNSPAPVAPQESAAQGAPATTDTAAAPAVTGSATVTAAPAPAPASAPAAKHFAVNGNDASADLTTLTVKKGTPVSITFGADAGTTYHGGLDFRSSVLSTGTITPGSTKTVSFTADSSFSFTPYWPSTNIAKPYKINVVVTP